MTINSHKRQREPLPTFYVCIAPSEEPAVINYLRGDGTPEGDQRAKLHLELCDHCKEWMSAARERCGALLVITRRAKGRDRIGRFLKRIFGIGLEKKQ